MHQQFLSVRRLSADDLKLQVFIRAHRHVLRKGPGMLYRFFTAIAICQRGDRQQRFVAFIYVITLRG